MLRAARSCVVMLCGWLLVGTTLAVGQEPPKPEGRKVVVTGTATAQVKPDAARVTFVITTTEAADKSAREANEKHVKSVKDALAGVALDKVEMEVHVLPTTITSLVVPAPNPGGGAGGGQIVQGKRAQSVFQVILRDKDLDKLAKAAGKIAETAANSGGTAVDADNNPVRPFRIRRGGGFGGPGGIAVADEPDPVMGPTIEWQATNPTEARREAIRRAVKEAQADAEAATSSMKLHVVEMTVTAGTPEDLPLRYRMRGDNSGTDNALIPLRVEVRVTYSY